MIYEKQKNEILENNYKKQKLEWEEELCRYKNSSSSIAEQKTLASKEIESIIKKLEEEKKSAMKELDTIKAQHEKDLEEIRIYLLSEKQKNETIKNDYKKQKIELEEELSQHKSALKIDKNKTDQELTFYKEQKKATIDAELTIEKETKIKFLNEWLELQKINALEKMNIEHLDTSEIDKKIRHIAESKLFVLEENLEHERQVALSKIFEWTETEKKRLQDYLEKEYVSKLKASQKDIENKVQEEFQHIQKYFHDFEKENESLVEADIKNFLDKKLATILSSLKNKD
ncbi:MAG: hypothetical protein HQK52_16295 [Oligoflexia bacterium]|nr:hypothetical protein [Oligoflexia bacterium]